MMANEGASALMHALVTSDADEARRAAARSRLAARGIGHARRSPLGARQVCAPAVRDIRMGSHGVATKRASRLARASAGQ